jgi:phosphoribosylamine--glycine ligase
MAIPSSTLGKRRRSVFETGFGSDYCTFFNRKRLAWMRVLLIGSGGREHALAWKLADSPGVTQLFVAPGNTGTAQVADNVALDPLRFGDVERFIRINGVQFVVIGPEDPLAAGLADFVRKLGVPVFGPSKAAAQMEADKWFAKEMMRRQAIPTAEARTFVDAAAAAEYVRCQGGQCVVKATGLAKGKGVTVCYREKDALDAIDALMRQRVFGEAGDRIVIEEKLSGPEVSILALVDRQSIYVMESAQDHKPVEDGDVGPMTGGMGAYSPAPVVSESMLRQIEREILVPVVDGLRREGIDYSGVLYAGLMITPKGPQVLEFNCRFGDPETQPLMMRLKSDLLEALLAVAEGRLDKIKLKWDPRPALCVVACSGGYPGKYKTGLAISGMDQADAMPDVKVFHAGTKLKDGQVVTDGGRVLAVTALGQNIAEAQRRAYQAMQHIHFEGMHYRKDIGHQAIRGV